VSRATNSAESVVRGYFEARNAGDDGEQFLAADFIRHSPPEIVGIAAYRAWLAALRTMWSDERWTVNDIASNEGTVWAWLTNESRHVGTWRGLPATDRDVVFDVVNIFRIREDRIAEMWRISDDWSRIRQLGGDIRWT